MVRLLNAGSTASAWTDGFFSFLFVGLQDPRVAWADDAAEHGGFF
jgi:hypothetical protein